MSKNWAQLYKKSSPEYLSEQLALKDRPVLNQAPRTAPLLPGSSIKTEQLLYGVATVDSWIDNWIEVTYNGKSYVFAYLY